MFFGSCIASGNAFLIYLESTGYWIIREDKTTPKVIVFSISFISLSGRVATSATESAPLMPPIMMTCLHAPVVFSFGGMATHSSILPGESHGQRRLEGYSPWGHKESD